MEQKIEENEEVTVEKSEVSDPEELGHVMTNYQNFPQILVTYTLGSVGDNIFKWTQLSQLVEKCVELSEDPYSPYMMIQKAHCIYVASNDEERQFVLYQSNSYRNNEITKITVKFPKAQEGKKDMYKISKEELDGILAKFKQKREKEIADRSKLWKVLKNWRKKRMPKTFCCCGI